MDGWVDEESRDSHGLAQKAGFEDWGKDIGSDNPKWVKRGAEEPRDPVGSPGREGGASLPGAGHRQKGSDQAHTCTHLCTHTPPVASWVHPEGRTWRAEKQAERDSPLQG